MKKINISTNKYPDTFALVDDEDFDTLSIHKWYAVSSGSNLYARRVIYGKGKSRILKMHIVIIGKVEGKEIDHKNGNSLDNQRHNLRHCTRSENQRNRGAQDNNTSGFKGVSWDSRRNKWVVGIRLNRKTIYLGGFFCLIKAARCYDKNAKKLHGEFAGLNFK